ncbi:MAG: acyltransferase family protein [Arenicellales bacterium]
MQDDKYLRPNALTQISFLVLVLVVALVSLSSPTHESIWRLEWLFAMLFFVMFISLIHSNGTIGRILSSRMGVSIGRASYSLYLTHIIAFHIVTKRVPHGYRGTFSAAIVIFALASVYHLIVERPFVVSSKSIRVK